ncbi:MAG: ABC transporter permease [Rhodospirillaceae bacterium]|nr:ABC transporter permease [Rhodospirillaceae bacterium]
MPDGRRPRTRYSRRLPAPRRHRLVRAVARAAARAGGTWRPVAAVFRRELRGYFATPLALVFLVIFLILNGILTFQAGAFFERGRADLIPFFRFHPWLYLLLGPALAMRLWAEERRSGTLEVLLTLPLTPAQAVVGKFLAAWGVLALALVLTLPMWAVVTYLGRPDHGVIAAGYLGSLLLAGAYLAVGAAASAIGRSQVVAFILAVAACFAFTAPGSSPVLGFLGDWLPAGLVEPLAWFSFEARFGALMRGVLDARDLVFFATTIALFLVFNTALVASGRRT